jgi:hypothetical protein
MRAPFIIFVRAIYLFARYICSRDDYAAASRCERGRCGSFTPRFSGMVSHGDLPAHYVTRVPPQTLLIDCSVSSPTRLGIVAPETLIRAFAGRGGHRGGATVVRLRVAAPVLAEPRRCGAVSTVSRERMTEKDFSSPQPPGFNPCGRACTGYSPLPTSLLPGRIESYGTTDHAQDLQVQAQTHY